MNKQHTFSKALTSGALAVALIAVWAVWPVSRVKAIGDPTDGKYGLGLARGQTARLTVINSGGERGFIIDWKFLDGEGRPLAQAEEPVEVPPGQMKSFDLDGDALDAQRDRFGGYSFARRSAPGARAATSIATSRFWSRFSTTTLARPPPASTPAPKAIDG